MNFGDPRTNEVPRPIDLYESKEWKLKDTLTVQISHVRQHERYDLLLVNGRRSEKTYGSVDGATYYGDFWDVLGIIFQASSQTRFEWDHWTSVGGQRVMVFRFTVAGDNSQWRLSYGSEQVVAALKGLVYIDPKDDSVLKIKAIADEIPKNFPIQGSGVELDYRPQRVAGREFILPLRALEWTDSRQASTKNEVEFLRYKKFTVDSKFDYDTPPPLPESEIKEKQSPNL